MGSYLAQMANSNIHALLDRAATLASSGEFRDWDEVVQRLEVAGFPDAAKELGAEAERIEIDRVCQAAINAKNAWRRALGRLIWRTDGNQQRRKNSAKAKTAPQFH